MFSTVSCSFKVTLNMLNLGPFYALVTYGWEAAGCREKLNEEFQLYTCMFTLCSLGLLAWSVFDRTVRTSRQFWDHAR